MNSQPLKEKIILITGATQGIGKAISVICALAGGVIIACGRNVAALETLSDEIVAAGGIKPSLLPINLANASTEDYKKIADHISKKYCRLDGIILNAAMLGELTPIKSYAPSMWTEVFQVNVHSNFLLLQELHELLLNSEMKSVIFTLASRQLTESAHWGAYGASKAALQSLMQMFALENTGVDQINVMGVVPPPTRSTIRMTAYPAEDQSKLANPDEVARTYLELLSNQQNDNQGKILEIDSS